ncbi:tetratricopeptide repeat protein [Streptomyces sp. NPDC006622]|uniref:ATP-binding protein n=1 Tax=Streptomyces sp. NPDC006622 TaxID=3155459 RepID=UPI0033B8C08F
MLRPTQLPGDLSVFAGRTTESAWLSAITATPERSRPAPPVVVVGGAPGIGKTTFAVHHAHQIAHLFPDGQLFVNLCGFHPHMPPVDPVDALHGFLAALGVPVQRVPEGLPARAALFRSLLAGRRVLIVLDNARDEEQVRPLLPSGPGCLTLITSRNQLPGLVTADGAKPLTLPLPSETEARETLARRLGSARLTAEPTATADLIRLCGRLPLALAVVTAHAALNPTFPLAAIADDLRHTHSRLDTLTTSDITTDVRAVFSWSYRSLEEPAARLFRLLALHPGPEITVPAAASLGGLPLPEARRLLAELTRARLVEQPLPGRYTLHDLLRDYATELIDAQGDAGERDDALLRVLDHYVFTAYAANRPLKRYSLPELDIDSPSTGVVPEEFTTPEQASRWLTTEQRVLSNLLHTAVSQGLEDHITGLAWSLEEHLHRQEHWPEAIAALTPALDVAQRRADRPTQGLCHRYLGEIHGRLGHQEQTMAHLRRATVLFEELGEANQQSLTHSTTAYVLNLFGRVEEALAAAEQALALARVAGDHVRVAMCLNNLAWLHSTSNRPEESLVYFEEAIGMLQDGDGSGIKAHFQDTLGYTLHLLNRYEEAVEAYRHALETYEKLGDHLHLIGSLMRLGDTHLAMGDREAARADWIRALDCADERQALSTSAQQVRDRLAALGGEASPAAVVPEGAHRRES